MQFQPSSPNVMQSGVTRMPQQDQGPSVKSNLINLAANAGIGLATGDWSHLASQSGLGGGAGARKSGSGSDSPTKVAVTNFPQNQTPTPDETNPTNKLASEVLTPELGQPLWQQQQQNVQGGAPIDSSLLGEYYFDPFTPIGEF